MNVTASCEGYKPYSQLLAPRPGQNEKLSIVLQKEATIAVEQLKRQSPATNGECYKQHAAGQYE